MGKCPLAIVNIPCDIPKKYDRMGFEIYPFVKKKLLIYIELNVS